MMKLLFIVVMVLPFFTACNSQKKPLDKAKEVQAAITQARPGTMPTKEGSWMMVAKINGKAWVAASVMPPEAAGRIVGYHNKEYIGLPYNKQYIKVGKKIALGEEEAADIFFTGVGLATTNKGQIEITKVEEGWAEGKFYFTETINGTDKVIEITDGFFRIAVAK
jgi:hypothetical protein